MKKAKKRFYNRLRKATTKMGIHPVIENMLAKNFKRKKRNPINKITP